MSDFTLEGAVDLYQYWSECANPVRALKLMMMYYHLISTEYPHHAIEPFYQYWYESVTQLPVDELYESINYVELNHLLADEIEAQPHEDDRDLIAEHVKALPLSVKQSSVDEFFS